ncbi:MAG: LytTR family DNA-binding domain-containing protein [Bacteroidales bacterium]
MIRSVVVDDEKPSREVICNYLKEFCPEVDVVATSGSVKGAYKTIKKHNPDLVFLDIELSDGKGFDLLNMFDKVDFSIIFVTAYSEHAVKAFRYSATDYLLKPVKIDELMEAVEKVKNNGNANSSPVSENIAELLNNLKNPSGNIPTLVIPHLKGYEVLKISEIIMCKADGYCTNFHLTDNRKTISSKNLKQYEELLAEHNFMRVHHSFIINMNHVTSFSRQGEISLIENNKASLGDNYKDSFVKRLGGK